MNLVMRSLVCGVAVLASLGGGLPAQAQSAPVQSWKVFQELDFLIGSWSGTGETGGRIGGRVGTWSLEMDGAALVYRANAIFPASGDLPEEKSQESATFVYDGDKRKYSALVVFSTKVWGLYDVDFPSEGTVRLASREFVNLEGSAKSRISFVKGVDGGLNELIEVALPGKDFAPFLSSKLNKK